MTTTRGTSFTTTERVVDRVHHDTADSGTLAEPAGAAGGTGGFIHVIDIGNLADNSEAVFGDEANFTTRETDLAELAVLGNEFGSGTGGADQLGTLARLHFDIVDHGVQRNVLNRHCVTDAEFDTGTRVEHVANLDIVKVNRYKWIRVLTR